MRSLRPPSLAALALAALLLPAAALAEPTPLPDGPIAQELLVLYHEGNPPLMYAVDDTTGTAMSYAAARLRWNRLGPREFRELLSAADEPGGKVFFLRGTCTKGTLTLDGLGRAPQDRAPEEPRPDWEAALEAAETLYRLGRTLRDEESLGDESRAAAGRLIRGATDAAYVTRSHGPEELRARARQLFRRAVADLKGLEGSLRR